VHHCKFRHAEVIGSNPIATNKFFGMRRSSVRIGPGAPKI